jgi:hypothetical protein
MELDQMEKDQERGDRWDLAKVLNQQDVELDEVSEDKLLKIRVAFFFLFPKLFI